MTTRKFHYPLYDSQEKVMNRKRLLVLLKSKAVWGAVFAAGAWLVEQPVIDAASIIQAAGGILTAVGVRDSIEKLRLAK